MQCTAHNKRTGGQCKKHAVTGYSVCNVHGAGSPKQGRPGGRPIGPTTQGRYSKYLPTRLQARYEEAEKDPELLNLRGEISLLDARLAELLGKLDSGESGLLWKDLQKQNAELQLAKSTGDTIGAMQALNEISSLIDRGSREWMIWGEIGGIVEQRRRLVESERKRLVEMNQIITIEQAMTLITSVGAIVRKYVLDDPTRKAIAYELSTIVALSPATSAGRSDPGAA